MLVSLSIRDIVLIDRLDMEFDSGLGVLTGETGAGKSILLDSLGLVLGGRGDSGLVRQGADRAAVTAAFALPDNHRIWDILDEQDIAPEDTLVLRRVVNADGRSRAFVNDTAVSVSLLKRLGDALVEIHGQHGEQGFLNPASHRGLLDAFGGLGPQAETVAARYRAWQEITERLDEARQTLQSLKSEEEYLRHVAEELEELAPEEGEEERLAEERTALMHGEKIIEAVNEAAEALGRDGGAERSIRVALRTLERVRDEAGERLASVMDGLERASVELAEAYAALEQAGHSFEIDPRRQEAVEERLFALRAAARKHNVNVDDLPALAQEFRDKLAALDKGAANVDSLAAEVAAARQSYEEAAEALSAARHAAAERLDAAVAKELPPLKLDKATFRTRIDPLPEDQWSAAGAEKVAFEVSTNPGAPMGPLAKIASGGELSRFVLALKVALAEQDAPATMIFDEVDQGVGGAVASAVGERLAQLAETGQVLVVTHSPQVAALAGTHWRVIKETESDSQSLTSVAQLDENDRLEEIARMLAGAQVTNEARAAAKSLLAR